MEYSIPPSYVEATSRDWLPVVAPYLSTPSLCNAILVSRRWHKTLIPWLWGDPASHFGTAGDRVYVALTRFKRTLPGASYEVRKLTHTLHLPPAQTELYGRPQFEWLRDVLLRLPNLKCLVVSQIPFFDHQALLALKKAARLSESFQLGQIPLFPLKLLVASFCNNCTPATLGPAFLQFPNLTFLDLSYTPAAREDNVLEALGYLHQLQILKLRRVGLRDYNLKILAEALHPSEAGHPSLRHMYRLRSLDVRDNYLTDESIQMIISKLIQKDRNVHGIREDLEQFIEQPQTTKSVPLSRSPPESIMQRKLRSADLDQYFIQAINNAESNRIYLEDLDHHGLTHLYISGNAIGVRSLVNLVRTSNLHVLDAGDLEPVTDPYTPRSAGGSASALLSQNVAPQLGKEQLTHPLEKYGETCLTYLRVHHALVTASAGLVLQESVELDAEEPQISPVHEVQSKESQGHASHELRARGIPRYELQADRSTVLRTTRNLNGLSELHGDLPAYELAATDVICAELAGSEIPFNRDARLPIPVSKHDNLPPYHNENVQIPISPISTYGLDAGTAIVSPMTHRFSWSMTPPSTNPYSGTETSISEVDAAYEIRRLVALRRALRHGIRDEKRGLLPGRLPALQTLVLTEVPGLTRTSRVIQNLQDFINDCATEHHLSLEQAKLEESLAHKRGVARGETIRARVHELFALQTLILDIAPLRSAEPSEADAPASSSPTVTSHLLKLKTATAVDDADAEAMWKASQNDFSFFDEEECGVPASEATNHFPMSTLLEKFAITGETDDTQPRQRSKKSGKAKDTGLEPLRDVVAEIARWRTEKKREFQAAASSTFVPGYWPGEIKILRTNSRSTQHEIPWSSVWMKKN